LWWSVWERREKQKDLHRRETALGDKRGQQLLPMSEDQLPKRGGRGKRLLHGGVNTLPVQAMSGPTLRTPFRRNCWTKHEQAGAREKRKGRRDRKGGKNRVSRTSHGRMGQANLKKVVFPFREKSKNGKQREKRKGGQVRGNEGKSRDLMNKVCKK